MPRARRGVVPFKGRGGYRRWTRLLPALFLVLVLIGVVGSGVYAAVRTGRFLHHVANLDNPVTVIKNEVEPPAGSIAWKLKNGQQINLLLLGYGGAENDAPWLTDSIMVVSIDPLSRRVLEASVPRDLYVQVDAWQDGRRYDEKINAAFEVGNDPSLFGQGVLKTNFQGKDGAGHLVEATVSRLTGITFDRYAAVDFKAFRDVVNSLGGITVQMSGPLDDCHYPDYANGYMNHGVPLGWECPPGAGIHFAGGTYSVNGEQALEIARSRDAIEPDQATDFGRARRQQMVVAAIRQKATSADAIWRVPQLMEALQNDFKTDMDLNDIKALYDFGTKLSDSSFIRLAITDQDLVDNYVPYSRGSCGALDAYALCPEDPTYQTWHTIFSHVFVDRRVLQERAPVQLVNATANSADLSTRLGKVLGPLGLSVSEGPRREGMARTVIYDYSGGRYPETTAWLEEFFGVQVVPMPSPAGSGAVTQQGLVVTVGNDYARRWYGHS